MEKVCNFNLCMVSSNFDFYLVSQILWTFETTFDLYRREQNILKEQSHELKIAQV